MGTRNLTMVISGGKTRIAQYGQWDGYPSGQGATVLAFLQKFNPEIFKWQCERLRWATTEDAQRIEANPNWSDEHPHLSRDCGAEILNAVHYGTMVNMRTRVAVRVEFLSDQSEFAKDSLFCEYAYVVDLDAMQFEVYEGFVKEPLPASNRFQGPANEGGYYPVKCAAKFPIGELPTLEVFLKELEPQEETDEF